MSDTSAVSIKYNDLAELGKAIEGNGGNCFQFFQRDLQHT